MTRISRPQPEKSAAPRHPDLVIAELAARQHGVVARRQLIQAGISDDAIAHRVALRRLHRLHAGAFSLSEHPGQRGRFLAAVLAAGDGAVISHRSAAALWELVADRGPVDVLVAGGGGRTRRGIRIHTTRALHADEVTAHAGIPCTTIARTAVDIAASASPELVRKLLERAIVLRLFDGRALDEALARANGRRGKGTLRRLLAELDETPPTRSELERRFLQLVEADSLPSPITNGLVNGYEVDFHWPDARLIVETDGRSTHDNPLAFERDRRRDLALTLAGWHVIRISWRQLTNEPDRVVALLRAKLD